MNEGNGTMDALQTVPMHATSTATVGRKTAPYALAKGEAITTQAPRLGAVLPRVLIDGIVKRNFVSFVAQSLQPVCIFVLYTSEQPPENLQEIHRLRQGDHDRSSRSAFC